MIDNLEFLSEVNWESMGDFLKSQEYIDNGFPIIFWGRTYALSKFNKPLIAAQPNYKEVALSLLSLEETSEMINFRCMVAGRQSIFSMKSTERIYLQTGGNPLKIISLCQMVLTFIASKKKAFADEDDVEYAIYAAGQEQR